MYSLTTPHGVTTHIPVLQRELLTRTKMFIFPVKISAPNVTRMRGGFAIPVQNWRRFANSEDSQPHTSLYIAADTHAILVYRCQLQYYERVLSARRIV